MKEKIAVDPKVAALLRRVCKRVLEEPRRVDMSSWVSKNHFDGGPPCGTVGCIAGWAIMDRWSKKKLTKLTDGDVLEMQVGAARNFAKLIGVDPWSPLFKSLVYVESWPEPFRSRYVRAEAKNSPRLRALATVARVKHYIKTGR